MSFSEAHYNFTRRHPAHAAWLDANADANEFAQSLRSRLLSGQELSERQFAALDRGVARESAPKVEAPKVTVAPMIAALEAAKAAGLKRQQMITEIFTFKRAPDHGRNPGAIYVTTTDDDVYMGKIMDGELIVSRDCSELYRDAIVEVCADPLKAAVEFGKATGICSCCARELTDPDSIAAGIGPICKRKYGI